jgi:hypothetical protein
MHTVDVTLVQCESRSTGSGITALPVEKANRESVGAADRVLKPRFDQDFPSIGSAKQPRKAPEASPGEFFNRLRN